MGGIFIGEGCTAEVVNCRFHNVDRPVVVRGAESFSGRNNVATYNYVLGHDEIYGHLAIYIMEGVINA